MTGTGRGDGSPACRPSSEAAACVRRLVVLVSVLLWFAGAAMASDRETRCGADCLAAALIEKIPEGESIALFPFGPPQTSIPEEVADRLYDRILVAMSGVSKGRHQFVGRDRNDELWSIAQTERMRSDFEAFWQERRVQVTVQCEDRGLRDQGIELSCVAFPVGEGSRLSGDVIVRALFLVPRPYFPYDYTMAALGHDLAGKAPAPKEVTGVFVLDQSGERTAFTEDIGERTRAVVGERFAARRRDLQAQVNAETALGTGGGETAALHGGYELRGRIAWMDERFVRVSLSLWDGLRKVATESTLVERDWLPSTLVGPLRYSASARAVVSRRLGKESAMRAVKNLARARVVAEAIGMEPPKIDEIRSEAHGVEALHQTLDQAIPVDEQFSDPVEDGDGGWEVTLNARVVAVGTTVDPKLEAKLVKDELRAMEELRIGLSAQEAVHVAVFAWGADNRVVRIYPNTRTQDLRVPAGGQLRLPRQGETPILVAPLPGNAADHEAIIVVAAGEPMDFDRLAPSAGESVKETREASVPGGRFFDRLADLDLSRAALTVLPYRVTAR